MSREIKFRVWDIKKNEWVNLDHGLRRGAYQCMRNTVIFPQPSVDPLYIFVQYTGLKDKKGVEIYEGDIVYSGIAGQPVVIGHGTWGYGDHNDDDGDSGYGWYEEFNNERFGLDDGFTNIEGAPSYYEVIGNIYENPELLK